MIARSSKDSFPIILVIVKIVKIFFIDVFYHQMGTASQATPKVAAIVHILPCPL